MIAAIFGRQPHSNSCANTKSSGGRRILRLPPLNISPADQIMSNHLVLQPGRARRKQPTTQPTSAVQNQILPLPTLPATSAPSYDSRRRPASCTNPQARISTPVYAIRFPSHRFPASSLTSTRPHGKLLIELVIGPVLVVFHFFASSIGFPQSINNIHANDI